MENKSENLNELFTALSKAQATMMSAIKDSKNPYFKSSYADLTSIWDAIRRPLAENGLCVVQSCQNEGNVSYLETWLGHNSGQWMKSRIPLTPAKNDPQTMGSYITYMRRYALSAMIGVVADVDDDGQRAAAAVKEEKIEAPKKVTASMIIQLNNLLSKDIEFKETVESFVMENLGLHGFDELDYKNYDKILKRTQQHLEAKNEKNGGN